MARPFAAALLVIAVWTSFAREAAAQDPPPKIGPFVVDFHGTFPKFTDDQQLADSRGITARELPKNGRGLHAAINLYLLKWKAVTFGLGVDGTFARAHSSAKPITTTVTGHAVTERFSHFAPDLSFNFGTGNGWSYLSGGIGPAQWSVVPEGSNAAPADSQTLRTINYGGGARWFSKKHVAFSLDVRFYAIDPGIGDFGRPGSPRTTLLFFGGGISIK